MLSAVFTCIGISAAIGSCFGFVWGLLGMIATVSGMAAFISHDISKD